MRSWRVCGTTIALCASVVVGAVPTVTFDIHNRTGKHLARLRIPQRPSREGLPLRARGNDVWIALRDADDVVSIARYRMTQ